MAAPHDNTAGISLIQALNVVLNNGLRVIPAERTDFQVAYDAIVKAGYTVSYGGDVGGEASLPMTATPAYEKPELRLLDYSARVLDELKAILVDRGGSYADFRDNSVIMMHELKNDGVSWPPDVPPYMAAAMFYIRGKLARLNSGDRFHRDSWTDCAGYAILVVACMDRDGYGRQT
jgi:hypothetical protein